jgi:signal transduction histidine kinase
LRLRLSDTERALREANESLERRVVERTVELEEALKQRDELVSVVGHELRTPITSMKLSFQVLSKRLKETGATDRLPGAPKLLGALERQLNRLHRLIEDMMDAHLRSGQLRYSKSDVALDDVVREAVAQLSPVLDSAGMRVRINLEDQLHGDWDRYRLEQVLMNLISNALKHAGGGTLTIAGYRRDEQIVIEVRDEGPGIRPEDLARIFQPFTRGARPGGAGMGLGLYIAQRIVEAHGGAIRAESEPGAGTTFIIHLPARPAQSVSEGEHANLS